jgi:hypothetical protein
MTTTEPGWDAKTIARIAKDHYGSFKGMFVAQGWPERGGRMMTSASKRIVARYGSIRQFEAKHAAKCPAR